MADTEKRISFKGVDSGAGSMMDQLRSKSQELGQSMIENTRRVSSSSDDFIKNLKEQISLEEKRIRLREQAQKFEASQTYQKEIESDDFNVRNQAESKYKEKTQEIDNESEEAKLQTELLRELVEETKQSAREEISENREQVEQNVGLTSKGTFDPKKQKEPESEEEALKLAYQKEELQKEQDKENVNNLRQKASDVGSKVGEGIMNPVGLLGSSGIIGALTAYGINQGNARQKSEGDLRGATGINFSQNYGQELTNLGIQDPELMDYTKSLSRTRGYATDAFNTQGSTDASNPVEESKNLMNLERRFGLDQGFLSGLSQYQSFDPTSKSTSNDVINTVNTLKQEGLFENEDFSRLPQLLETQNDLAMQQVQYLDKIDMGTNANLLASFEQVGGQFGNPQTQSQLVTGLDESLRNPQNKFQRAFDYSVIQNLNPDAGYLETQKAMEQGLAYTGEDGRSRLGQSLRQMNKRGGGSQKALELGIQGRFGDQLSFEQGETLAKAFQQDSDIFKGIDSKNEALSRARKVTQGSANQQAGEQRATIDALLARISDEFGETGQSGLEFLENKLDIAQDAGMKTAIKDALNDFSAGWLGENYVKTKDVDSKDKEKNFKDMVRKMGNNSLKSTIPGYDAYKLTTQAYNYIFENDEDNEKER